MCLCDAGGGHDVRVLYHSLDPVVLSQNAPEHASAVDPERLVPAFSRTHNIVIVLPVVSAVVVVRRLVQRKRVDRLDAGQETHRPPRRVLLHRVRLQRLVHVRDHDPVRRESEQTGFHPRPGQHHRLRRHAVFLPRLFAHLPQKGLLHHRPLLTFFV